MTKSVSKWVGWLAVGLAAFAACGTPGAPASANLSIVGASRTFTTASGWDVELSAAHLLVGGVVVFAPAPQEAASLPRWLERGLGPSLARAHGGHDSFGGRPVRLDWTGPAAFDLLAPRSSSFAVGAMRGSVGASAEASLVFPEISGEFGAADSTTRGHHAWIAGTASRLRVRDGVRERIRFEGGLTIPTDGLRGLVEGIEASFYVDRRGHVQLQVLLERWLDEAHFDRLEGDDVKTIGAGDQISIAWELGLRDPRSYRVVYEPAREE